ncbi:MAG: glycosyltransferase [Ignavibacteriaceae bacterium]
MIISPRGQLGDWCLSQGSKFKKLWLKVFISPFINDLTWHMTSEKEKIDVKAVYPTAKTFVIPNGIDISNYENRDQRKEKIFYKKYTNNIDKNSLVIITMGRLQKVKGFDILINAFKIIKNKCDNCFLFIAGEEYGDKENLLKQIRQLGLNDLVYLVGHIDGEEKINFLKNADVFALPSHHENFGMVYAEALAAGTPIVASKNTPWEEVEKYNCGKWVENTADAFAKAIKEILVSDDKDIGVRGRKFMEENYSWKKIAKDFTIKLLEIQSDRK